MIFAIFTLLSALSISIIAAYFSIIGLATIFPGSIEAVIAMGAALEIGKIVAAIWLHKNWKSAPTTLKIYLFSAIVVLMGITSMGIFGFLSKSHIEHEQNSIKSQALVEQVETKIERENEYIQRQKDLISQNKEKNQNLSDKSSENIELEQKKISQLTEQLEKDIDLDNKMLQPIQARINQLNEELNAVKNKSGGLFSNKKKEVQQKISDQASEREELSSKKKEIENRISKYRNETSNLVSEIRKRIQDYQTIGFEKPENVELKIEELNKNISDALNRIDDLERQKFDLDDGSRQLEAEVGPVKYVAELIADFTGMEFDMGKAVRIVIIILIFVFDPLAVLLVLAAHISLSKKFPKAMQDEAIAFEKIAELEAQQKILEKEQLDIEERKKDIEQEKKIIELQENQVQKYQEEISENKEVLRNLKLESQKELLKQEDTSAISAEIEQLIAQKENAEDEIKEIKIKKNKLLDRAEETIKSAKEIKAVLGDHNKHKETIAELKSEICINLEEFKKIKAQVQALESKNKSLINSEDNLKKEIESLNAIKNEKPNKELEAKISDLISQKNQLLEENINIKKSSRLIITKESLPNGKHSLTIPCAKGGSHVFTRPSTFTNVDIFKLIEISEEINKDTSNDESIKNNIFQSMVKSLIDPQLSNRDYNKSKPIYKYIS
jgi:chromosome segregation ATPase